VIANWSFVLVRDTGGVLMDVRTDDLVTGKVKSAIEAVGDRLVDLHIWRLGPGHLGAVLSVVSDQPGRCPQYYHQLLGRFEGLSHITVEVNLPL